MYILLAIIYTEIKLSMAKYISPVRLQVDWCLPKYSVFEIRRGHGFKVQTTGRGNNWEITGFIQKRLLFVWSWTIHKLSSLYQVC